MAPKVLDIFDKVCVMEDYAQKLDSYKILGCDVNTGEKAIDLYLEGGDCNELLPIGETRGFIDMTKEKYSLDRFDIFIKYPGLSPTNEYIEHLVRLFEAFHDKAKAFLSGAKCLITENIVRISDIIGSADNLEKMGFSGFLKKRLRYAFGLDINVELVPRKTDMDEYLKRQAELDTELARKAVSEALKSPAKKQTKTATVFGRKIDDAPVPIISLNEETKKCVVEGEIFDCETRLSVKGGRRNTIANFSIGDDEWATCCRAFGSEDKLKNLVAMLRDGNRLRVAGEYAYNEYARKYVIDVKSAMLLPKPEIRKDEYPRKRVELHLHTKMSALDAVSSVSELVERARYWGHPAMAITDHGVAQGFPDAHNASKDAKDFKMIYGMEGYLINDISSSKLNEIRRIKGGEYVVFDLETTGLSPETERITEIGAVRVRDGLIRETFSQLVNPEKEISAEITALTGITNEMVKDMPTIADVLPKFKKFCGGATLVAHNAKFDTSFIYAAARRTGLYFDNDVEDTLDMSRQLFPAEKHHKLDMVCERLGVSLENHHRASDDAAATAECFIKMKEMGDWKAAEPLEEAIKIPSKDDPIIKTKKYHIILLAQNYTGLKNLYRIISASNLDYFYRKPCIPKSLLHKLRSGLIIGSACEAGELYRAMVDNKPESELKEIAEFYDYLEIQPIGNNAFLKRMGQVKDDDELIELNKRIVALGDSVGRKTVATCDVHFMDPKDEMYRRVLLGGQGFEDADHQPPLYLRTTEEMLAEFSYLGDRTEEIVIDNTIEIADMCERIQPVRDGSYPPTIENCEKDLLDMCHKKAHDIYGDVLPDIVKERMDIELDYIVKNGYSVMYIIAHKLVKKSNDAGYMVGSRGSVGSSFAAFLSDITEVNALCPHYICPECKYSEFYENGEHPTGVDMPDKNCPKCGAKMHKDGLDIPFATFLGFEGAPKVPDIDLNFSGEYQATAHKYVGELFGEEYVFKAGTIGTLKEKNALGYARKYYEAKGINAPEPELKRISRGLVNVKKTTGQHPGGIMVCPKTMDIHDFTPIQHPADKKDSDIITTHFDFHSIHDNLLKLDILGHDDPSTIKMLEDLTGVDALKIPLDDKDSLSLFSSTDALGVTPKQIDSEVGTFGIPEFGTNFVRGMLIETRPKTFVELLIISGLSHGTDVWLNNAQDLIRTKTCTLSEVIGLRDDIMSYLIRKGLEPGTAFRIMEYVRKGKAASNGMPPEFENTMREHDVPEWYINSCKKIKYMFPKAHAAAYVMMALRIAYFKIHYPIEFYMAYFTVRADLFDATIMTKGEDAVKAEMKNIRLKGNDASDKEKSLLTILEICIEMYERGFDFLPANIYKSHAYKFRKEGNKIIPPLNAFAGVGTAAAEAIEKAKQDGEFLSKEDLKNRAGVNKLTIDTLSENGVLGDLPDSSQISF